MNDQDARTFNQLSEGEKAVALDAARYDEVDGGSNWWDSVYEDAVRTAALIGIVIGATTRQYSNDYSSKDIHISFSGFASQGDGANFTGAYAYEAGAVEAIRADCPNDEELIAIASELTALQVAAKLEHGSTITCNVSCSGRDCHSGSMGVDIVDLSFDAWDINLDEESDALLALMRRFADWIYDRLEEQHDYLTSDEAIIERFKSNETLFDDDGVTI